MDLQFLLDYRVFGISVVRWSLILVCVLLTVVVLSALKRFILERIETLSETHEDLHWLNYVEAMFAKTKIFLYLAVGLFVGLAVFPVAERFTDKGQALVQVLVIVQIGVWVTAAGTVLIERFKSEIEDDPAQVTALSAVNFLIDAVIWSLVVLLALDNLGFDVTALIASMGIGGVAVALAAQKILGDLFAFFSIIVDKPFLRGDFLSFDDQSGTVEQIGIKTTRLRSLDGEQVVISNEDLLNTRIRNFKRMQNRRVSFEFGVTYDTPPDTVDAIPEIVEEIVRDQDLVDFDRVHLADFGESSLRYEVVYSVETPEFNTHMDIRQAILSGMFRAFRSRDIDFAFPTRTVHLGKSEDGEEPEPTRRGESDEESTVAA